MGENLKGKRLNWRLCEKNCVEKCDCCRMVAVETETRKKEIDLRELVLGQSRVDFGG